MGYNRQAGALGLLGVHYLGPIWVPFGVPFCLGPICGSKLDIFQIVIHIQIMASQNIQYSDISHDLIGGQ